jgi:hypothetical protein
MIAISTSACVDEDDESEPEAEIEVNGNLYSTPSYSNTTWIFPDNTTSSSSPLLSTRYYVELRITNTGEKEIKIPSINAYFYYEDSDVLIISYLNFNKLEKDRSTVIPLDTNGYTQFLADNIGHNNPLYFCVRINGGDEINMTLSAILPPYNELNDKTSETMFFSPVDNVPCVDGMQLIQAENMTSLGYGYTFITPAKGYGADMYEAAVYFYYKKE